MASHRKPRPRRFTSPASRAAAGLTTAAIATLTLLSETATAAPAAPPKPKPSIAEVKDQVDKLYREAEAATNRYNAAQEKTGKQRKKVSRLLDQVADQTASLNDARRRLGRYATEQYRAGAVAPSTTLFLADDPQSYFDQKHLMGRLAQGQDEAVRDFAAKQAETNRKRREASKSLTGLTDAQKELAGEKRTVQRKLADARKLLSDLTEEEKQRLAALERKRKAEAAKEARDLAEKERARKAQQATAGGSGSTSLLPPSVGYSSSRAAKAVSFARSQIGKPYVWGATGPTSYDCSGLTQAAWRAAGVSLPRVTYDQVNAGTRVPVSQMEAGDLVFFYDDISHVGLYIGGGQMIHAPRPGSSVKVAPVTEMPIYGAVRPG